MYLMMKYAFDLGYRRYEGRRLGRKGAFLALYMDGVRACFGLGRPARSKVVPVGLLVLALLIFGQILFLLIERRNGTPGASLQLRLVSLFSVIAVVPAIVVAIFATVTLNRGLDAWFSQRTRAIVDSAVYVAETYVHDHGEAVQTHSSRSDEPAGGRTSPASPELPTKVQPFGSRTCHPINASPPEKVIVLVISTFCPST